MKSLSLNKSIAVLLCILTLGFFSCEPEQVDSKQNLIYLPSVASTEGISANHLATIKKLNSNIGGRTNESLNFDAAITATYEGFEGAELVYIPDANSDNSFAVYTFINGDLIDLTLTIENNEKMMTVKNNAGIIAYEIDENVITNANIVSYSNSGGRTAGCNLAGDFMACGNAVQDQLVGAVGSWGALAFDIGCSLWVVCRGAVVISCAAYAGVQCAK